MNAARKRLKLSTSKLQSATDTSSHDALLLPPTTPAGGGAEEAAEEGYLLVMENTTDSSLVITMEDSQVEVKAARRKAARKRSRKVTNDEESGRASESEEEEAGVDVEIDRQLDQSLETKSKQHNLTTVNVRNIIHEVITNEHVVAMMKAAINETEAVPPFEPKMTRSKFKEVVEKGVVSLFTVHHLKSRRTDSKSSVSCQVIPAWNISPIKKTSDAHKAPQFVDIPLAEEDSSDEEYRPDEEDEDETAEDTFQESDMESTTSSPRGSRLSRVDEESCSPWQSSRSRSRCLRAGPVSMGPPPPPKAPPPKAVTDRTFLEKLHAVEEELAVCMEPYQPLSESEDEAGLMAYRTRSKRPLRDIPLGQLEAELRAPDITPDMYDSSSAHEDREWTDWLRGLMTSDMDNEEECDDEDDPEYNFLADNDEPDLEDYRDDKAVRITKKEVNELMEELFETLKEDLAGQEVDDEGHEEEEEPQEETQIVQTHAQQQHTAVAEDEQEDGPITGQRTVKQQLALIRRRQTHTPNNTHCTEPHTLRLNAQQKTRLQQQLQQHVQLLTQVHLLSSPVSKLQSEAETSRQFLFELNILAQRGELIRSADRPGFCSVFRASNLQGALQLLEELRQAPISYQPQLRPPDARGYMRSFPVMPAELAWIFATRPVFLYPELLPCASLDPNLYCPRRTAAFTAAEDCLLVLGLRNMEGSCDPPKLVSQFLLRKTLVQVRRRILQCCRPGFPDNIVKAFRYQRLLWSMPVACRHVDPAERRPPVEREESVMPLWLVRSLPVIFPTISRYNDPSGSTPEAPHSCRGGVVRQSQLTFLRSAPSSYSFPPSCQYPPRLPDHLGFRRIGFVLLQQPLPHPPTGSSPSPPPADFSSSPPPANFSPSPPPADFSPSPPPADFSSSPPPADFSSSPPPPRAPLQRLLQTRTDNPANITPSSISTATRERIRRHCQMLACLRRSRVTPPPAGRDALNTTLPPPPEGPSSLPLLADDVIRVKEEEEEEEEEEEGDIRLTLSESSSSAAGSDDDLEEAEPDRKQEQTLPSREKEDRGTSSDESRASVVQLQEEAESADSDGDDQSEDVAFAQDYLHRVCDAIQVSTGLPEQLLQVLDEFSAAGPQEAPDVLYSKLSSILQPWPQLLRDFAAFLNCRQAQRCSLLLEQQLFERSRRFLRRLRRSLGESSAPYQQVVSVLQGSPAPSPEDMDQLSSLLRLHPHLQQEVCDFLSQLHAPSLPKAASADTDCISHNPPDRNIFDPQTANDRKERAEPRVAGAKNNKMEAKGGEVVTWTRDADRLILTTCQQRGANQSTFRQVSAQLGNRTVQQVRLRFKNLMKLFHSTHKSTCSSENWPSRQDVAPD
ncbi:GON-4-like protein isoform X1 [Amphiprion ocellaris]|uniref:GON-4-like protein isoform X1 n=1 Tax=Amphiprion ocellaris TaxID=80972 RepID=UPI00241150AE|nr:GON-4-like protein isoform X1 [Amphiprion ocellaris]XP_035808718.2 GON-4-like protein isoform X1 [Amphiprion ocellaris]